jgi:hypothetical protein
MMTVEEQRAGAPGQISDAELTALVPANDSVM